MKGKNMKKLFLMVLALTVSACVDYGTKEEKSLPRFVADTPYHFENKDSGAPHLYSVVAARVTNQMLGKTKSLYTSRMNKIYILPVTQSNNEELPEGLSLATQTSKEIIKGSNSFQVVKSANLADYFLETSVKKLNVKSLEGTILQYKLTLLDKHKKQIGTWSETIRQVQNDDKSWW